MADLVLLLAVAALAAALAWLVARLRPFIDIPNARSSHAAPTPRGGGIGIVIAAGAGANAWLIAAGASDIGATTLAGLFTAAAVMAVGGLVDDMRRATIALKFGAQATAAAIAVACGVGFEHVFLPGLGTVSLGILGPPITVLWLVGMTNAYNFMDGLDGLAGGVAALAGGFLAIVAALLGAGTVAGFSAILAAASLGFLACNFPPARVFMGDVGSQFLGFALAALCVVLARRDASGGLFYLGPILFLHFIFDTMFTFVRRLATGENIVAAHRGHLYQRLNQSGYSHARVAALLYAMTMAQGVAAIWAAGRATMAWPQALVAGLAVQAAYAYWLLRRLRKRVT